MIVNGIKLERLKVALCGVSRDLNVFTEDELDTMLEFIGKQNTAFAPQNRVLVALVTS